MQYKLAVCESSWSAIFPASEQNAATPSLTHPVLPFPNHNQFAQCPREHSGCPEPTQPLQPSRALHRSVNSQHLPVGCSGSLQRGKASLPSPVLSSDRDLLKGTCTASSKKALHPDTLVRQGVYEGTLLEWARHSVSHH